jgi:hypothetical protein
LRPIPDELADVALVLQHRVESGHQPLSPRAGSLLPVSPWGGDAAAIEVRGDGLQGLAIGCAAENLPHDIGILIRPTARTLPRARAEFQCGVRAIRDHGPEFLRHDSGQAGLHPSGTALAIVSVLYADHADASVTQTGDERGQILRTREPGKVRHEQGVAASQGIEGGANPGAIAQGCAADPLIRVLAGKHPLLGLGILSANAELIGDGRLGLTVSRITGVDDGSHATSFARVSPGAGSGGNFGRMAARARSFMS